MSVAAFNVHNMEYTQAVISAAEEENAPVILMLGEPILAYTDLDMLANIALFAADKAHVDVAVALDHGKKMEYINRCIDLGICVMADFSALPYEENVRATADVVRRAHEKGLSVEGELGSLAGVEDVDEQAEQNFTDPEKATDYVRRTGVDIFAVSIGNCHGKYLRPPKLDLERLAKIRSMVDVPIVMHGGSDIEEKMCRDAIDAGIKKFNIGTDLKYAMSTSLKEVLNREPMPFQPQHTLWVARSAVAEVAKQKIRIMKNGKEY